MAHTTHWNTHVNICRRHRTHTHTHTQAWGHGEFILCLFPSWNVPPPGPPRNIMVNRLRLLKFSWVQYCTKFTAISGLPACVCVCPVSPPYMHMCIHSDIVYLYIMHLNSTQCCIGQMHFLLWFTDFGVFYCFESWWYLYPQRAWCSYNLWDLCACMVN